MAPEPSFMVGKISGVGRDRLIASGRFSLDGLAQNIALKSAAFWSATTGLDLVRWPRTRYTPQNAFGAGFGVPGLELSGYGCRLNRSIQHPLIN
jgi:hypothetical protein